MTEAMQAIIKEQAIARLEDILRDTGDIEQVHCDADDVLCELLNSLGFTEVVTLWSKVPKWYA